MLANLWQNREFVVWGFFSKEQLTTELFQIICCGTNHCADALFQIKTASFSQDTAKSFQIKITCSLELFPNSQLLLKRYSEIFLLVNLPCVDKP